MFRSCGLTVREATVQKIFLAGIAAAGLWSGSPLAADLPTKAPVYKAPIAAPPYNWSGFYVGANFGGGWSNGGLNIPGNNLYGGLSEFIGGVQAGYNFQAGHFLFGVEGDFDGAGFARPVLPTPTLGFVDQHWIGTVAGRAGVVNDRWLVFAKLGGGWVHSNATLGLPGTVWSGSSTSSGWLAGAGIEYGFKSHWTVKLEYDYLGLSNWNSGPFRGFEPRPSNGQSRDQL
jgi:opacity protein-like surface antigen